MKEFTIVLCLMGAGCGIAKCVSLYWVTGGGDPLVSDRDFKFVSPKFTAETAPKARPASDFQ